MMTARKRALASLALAAGFAPLLFPSGAMALVEVNLISQFGGEVDLITGADICTVESKDVCQQGTNGQEEYRLSGGWFSFPKDVAVDQNTGDVYVSDSNDSRVEKFDGEGNFILMFGGKVDQTTGANVCTAASKHTCWSGEEGAGSGQFDYPTGLAVEQSTGDVYVADRFNYRVQKFGPEGKFILMFGREVNADGTDVCMSGETCQAGVLATGVDGGFGFLNRQNIVAVGGPSELVYVGDEGRVEEFEASGKWKADIAMTGTVTALAVDGGGDMYLHETGVTGAQELSPSGGTIVHEFDNEPNASVTAITLTDTGYVVLIDQSGGFHGRVYNPSGGLVVGSFGASAVETGGIAYSNNAVGLYLARTGWMDVEIFKGPVVFPHAVTGGFLNLLATSVTLTGEVNPEGLEAHSFFEYGPCGPPPSTCGSAYGNETAKVDDGKGLVNVPVPATGVTGLEPNMTYHYRLVAENTNGPTPGGSREFTTPAVAPVLESAPQPPSYVSFHGATLNGEVNPENLPTRYHFVYAPHEIFAACVGAEEASAPEEVIAPSLSAGAGYGLEAVTQEVIELKPSTTYHYELVATNAKGRVCGPEGTFPTAPAPVLEALTGAASSVTQSTAVISGTLNPNGVPAIYRFEVAGGTGGGLLYGTVTLGEAGPVSAPEAVSVGLSGLLPATTYSYRLVAVNAYGTVEGAVGTFTTLAAPPPAFTQPIAPPLLATPAIAFPKEPAKVTPKKLTRAQQLANALKACAKKPKSKRAACRRAAQKKYAPKPKKKGK